MHLFHRHGKQKTKDAGRGPDAEDQPEEDDGAGSAGSPLDGLVTNYSDPAAIADDLRTDPKAKAMRIPPSTQEHPNAWVPAGSGGGVWRYPVILATSTTPDGQPVDWRKKPASKLLAACVRDNASMVTYTDPDLTGRQGIIAILPVGSSLNKLLGMGVLGSGKVGFRWGVADIREGDDDDLERSVSIGIIQSPTPFGEDDANMLYDVPGTYPIEDVIGGIRPPDGTAGAAAPAAGEDLEQELSDVADLPRRSASGPHEPPQAVPDDSPTTAMPPVGGPPAGTPPAQDPEPAVRPAQTLPDPVPAATPAQTLPDPAPAATPAQTLPDPAPAATPAQTLPDPVPAATPAQTTAGPVQAPAWTAPEPEPEPGPEAAPAQAQPQADPAVAETPQEPPERYDPEAIRPGLEAAGRHINDIVERTIKDSDVKLSWSAADADAMIGEVSTLIAGADVFRDLRDDHSGVVSRELAKHLAAINAEYGSYVQADVAKLRAYYGQRAEDNAQTALATVSIAKPIKRDGKVVNQDVLDAVRKIEEDYGNARRSIPYLCRQEDERLGKQYEQARTQAGEAAKAAAEAEYDQRNRPVLEQAMADFRRARQTEIATGRDTSMAHLNQHRQILAERCYRALDAEALNQVGDMRRTQINNERALMDRLLNRFRQTADGLVSDDEYELRIERLDKKHRQEEEQSVARIEKLQEQNRHAEELRRSTYKQQKAAWDREKDAYDQRLAALQQDYDASLKQQQRHEQQLREQLELKVSQAEQRADQAERKAQDKVNDQIGKLSSERQRLEEDRRALGDSKTRRIIVAALIAAAMAFTGLFAGYGISEAHHGDEPNTIQVVPPAQGKGE